MNREYVVKILLVILIFSMHGVIFLGFGNVMTAESREQEEEGFRVAENSSKWESEDYKALQRAFYESPFFRGFTDEQLQKNRAEIQKMIREAEALKNNENYIEALRVLFDAMYKEQRVQLLLGVDGTNQFPSLASEALDQLGTLVFQDDHSPLGQLFRDPDFPIREKRQYIEELRDLASIRVSEGEQILFREKYGGLIVQLMTSPRLSEGEKFHLLWYIEMPVSATQQQRIREEIAQLSRKAEQKIQAQQYVEALVLLTEAYRKADDIQAPGILHQQEIDIVAGFVQSDKSPLMKLFKSRLTSSRTKQRALDELLRFISSGKKTFSFNGKEYNGQLVQIFSHPNISGRFRSSISRKIKAIIETWHYSPIP